MGKKIFVPCFDVIMIAFFLFSSFFSFTVYFSEKRRSLLRQNKAQGSFFPLQSYSKKTLRNKCSEKRSKIQMKCAHAPWASYNTP